jgi:hypothetical protein
MATREQSIYIAYKAAVNSRRKEQSPNPEVLAIVDVSKKLRVSPIFVMNLVKSREPK